MKEVEKFRLTKDQLGWMKEAKKINRIEGILAKGVLQDWFKKGESLKRIFGQLGEKRKMLNMVAPEEKTNEIPGQEMERQREGEELFGGGETGEEMGSGEMGMGEGFVR